ISEPLHQLSLLGYQHCSVFIEFGFCHVGISVPASLVTPYSGSLLSGIHFDLSYSFRKDYLWLAKSKRFGSAIPNETDNISRGMPGAPWKVALPCNPLYDTFSAS